MNEVSSTQIAKTLVVSAASSTVSDSTEANARGKNLPPADAKADKAELTFAQKIPEKELSSAVANVKDYVQSLQRDIQFSVDKDLDRTVVKVVDSDSGEVIRQIPDDIFLELARRLKDDGEFRLLNALG